MFMKQRRYLCNDWRQEVWKERLAMHSSRIPRLKYHIAVKAYARKDPVSVSVWEGGPLIG